MSAPIQVEKLLERQLVRLGMREGVRGETVGSRTQVPDARFLELRRLQNLLRRYGPAFGQEIQVRRAGWRGSAERLVKRIMRKLLRWYAWPQIELNEAIAEAFRHCLDHLVELDDQVAVLRAALRNGTASATSRTANDPSESCALDYYFKFEERFRGTRADILKRQRPYLEFYRGRGPVLDIGCGRGEFLELLHQAGLIGHGIDINPDMTAECGARGLHAMNASALDYLTSLSNGALGGIFAGQVIEHLPPAEIGRLMQLARDRLAWEGVMILETPNPICEQAMRNFYIDPTHVRPVHPELARFLGEQAGLRFSQYIFSAPLPGTTATNLSVPNTSDYDLSGYRDYAIVLERK